MIIILILSLQIYEFSIMLHPLKYNYFKIDVILPINYCNILVNYFVKIYEQKTSSLVLCHSEK